MKAKYSLEEMGEEGVTSVDLQEEETAFENYFNALLRGVKFKLEDVINQLKEENAASSCPTVQCPKCGKWCTVFLDATGIEVSEEEGD